MPIYHIELASSRESTVLFRLKKTITPSQLQTWKSSAEAMVGKIPGLLSLKANAPLPICVPRAKGFDMGFVAVLESKEDLSGYAGHEVHLEVQRMREELCEDTLAFDLEF